MMSQRINRFSLRHRLILLTTTLNMTQNNLSRTSIIRSRLTLISNTLIRSLNKSMTQNRISTLLPNFLRRHKRRTRLRLRNRGVRTNNTTLTTLGSNFLSRRSPSQRISKTSRRRPPIPLTIRRQVTFSHLTTVNTRSRNTRLNFLNNRNLLTLLNQRPTTSIRMNNTLMTTRIRRLRNTRKPINNFRLPLRLSRTLTHNISNRLTRIYYSPSSTRLFNGNHDDTESQGRVDRWITFIEKSPSCTIRRDLQLLHQMPGLLLIYQTD